MLIRLYGENFRSLKAPFELSLVAANLPSEEDENRGIIEVPIAGTAEPLRLLRTVAIFGHNASGKSNILLAARALEWFSTKSSERMKPNDRIPPYDPFALDSSTRTTPVLLGCDVTHNDTILRYELEYTHTHITSESLRIFSKGRRPFLIKRDKKSVTGDLIERSEANKLYVKEMQPNVSVLSKLAQHGPAQGDESIRPYFASIANSLDYVDYSSAAMATPGFYNDPDIDKFHSDLEYRAWVMNHLIRASDLGICDVTVGQEEITFPRELGELRKRLGSEFEEIIPKRVTQVSFVHKGNSQASIPLRDESSGTRKLLMVSPEWWRLSHQPFTLWADELGASLHPLLLDNLIRSINSPGSTSARSQVIFTSHETALLESLSGKPSALRRDQVYFAKKKEDGSSELYSLTEFKDDARSVHNIRKRYMSGMYDAVPILQEFPL